MDDRVDRLIERTARRLRLRRSIDSAARGAIRLLFLAVSVSAAWAWLPSAWAVGAIVVGGALSGWAARSRLGELRPPARWRGLAAFALAAAALTAGLSGGQGLAPGWLAGWAVMVVGGLAAGGARWARGVTPRQAGRVLGEAVGLGQDGGEGSSDADGRFATWADVRGTDAARSPAGRMLQRQCLDAIDRGRPERARPRAMDADTVLLVGLMAGLVWGVWVVSAPRSEADDLATLARQARRATGPDRAELADALRRAARARGQEAQAEALRRAAVLVVEGRDAEATARLLREAGLEPGVELPAELLAALAARGAAGGDGGGVVEAMDGGWDAGGGASRPAGDGGSVRVYTPPAGGVEAGDGAGRDVDGGGEERFEPLGGAWRRAQREAGDALRRGSVPPRLRELVRAYFRTDGEKARGVRE